MQELDCASRPQGALPLPAQEAGRLDGEEGPQALAAAQGRMPHGRQETGGAGDLAGAGIV
jgi:hypothetical protein